MSKSWANIIKEPTKVVSKVEIVVEEEIEPEVDIEMEMHETRFMEYYGYTTSNLWLLLKKYIEHKPHLLCKPKNSLKLHDFLYKNIYIRGEQLDMRDEYSDELSATDEDYDE